MSPSCDGGSGQTRGCLLGRPARVWPWPCLSQVLLVAIWVRVLGTQVGVPLPLQGEVVHHWLWLQDVEEVWSCLQGGESHLFPGTSMEESALGRLSRVPDTAGWAPPLKRTALEVVEVAFLLHLSGRCPGPCQVILPEGWAHIASARSPEPGFLPSSVIAFHQAQSLLVPEGRLCDVAVNYAARLRPVEGDATWMGVWALWVPTPPGW